MEKNRYLNSPLAWQLFTVMTVSVLSPICFFGIGIYTIITFFPDTPIQLLLNNIISIFIITVILSICSTIFFIQRHLSKLFENIDEISDAMTELAYKKFHTLFPENQLHEFKKLSKTFNHMSRHLQRQFNVMETMGYIDRMILSSPSVDQIVSVLLSKMPEMILCNNVLFIYQHDPLEKKIKIYKQNVDKIIESKIIKINQADLDFFSENQEPTSIDVDNHYFSFLQHLKIKCKSLIIFPVFLENQFHAAIIFTYRNQNSHYANDIMAGKDLAQRVAVALSNVMWEEKLYHKAHYDVLTQLPNRALFYDRLKQVILQAERDNSKIALLYLDMDKFKNINDTLGHEYGDQFLQVTASRLQSCVRESDTVSRIGGDEFTIIIPAIHPDESPEESINKIIDKILLILQQPFELNKQEIHSSVSIGVALFPKDGNTLTDLITHADSAMYQAKLAGKNTAYYYSSHIHKINTSAIRLENRLEGAVKNNEFCLHFQPYVDIKTNQITGAEALLRWQHPKKGILFPTTFLPTMEKTDLLKKMGEWTLVESCHQLKRWHEAGFTNMKVSVNLSAQQLRHANVVNVITSALILSNIDPNKLEIEITENSLLHDIQHVLSLLTELSNMGVRISIDDFGTGYSSLSYLRQLPIDTLKIDKSFISELVHDKENRAIISTIINLGHELDLEIIAEGVESESDLNILKQSGCDFVQGFIYSKPVSSDEFILLLGKPPFPIKID